MPRSKRLQRVRLQREAFDLPAAALEVRRPDCGATVLYLGSVRETPHGGGRRRVTRLEYETFEEMAVAKLKEVRKEALRRFDIRELILHHRIGNFAVGEDVVMLAVAAPHRDEALRAALWTIAEMKQTVPIWKREVYRQGKARWVVGEMRAEEVVARRPSARRRSRA